MTALALGATACTGKSDPAGEGSGTDGSSGGIPTASLSGDASNTNSTPDGSGGGTSSAEGEDATTDTAPATDDGVTSTAESGGSDGTGPVNDPGDPLDCGGTTYACGNGEDDDGDGFIDLIDPECTGPCDNDESSFQTGLPGDNVDCKQDCFFDGNSGQGDDGCIWDLRCDPENPGANIGCEYTGGNNCNNQPPNQTDGCIMFCSQFVPPGCDCFGCCTVETDEGSIDIFLNSGEDCSLDNLAGCQTCTSQIEICGTPCVPEKCLTCFGETEPPKGCEDPTCPNEMLACESNAECPTDYFCLLGCCYPPPPG